MAHATATANTIPMDSFRMGYVFGKHGGNEITSLDFHREGKHCVTSSSNTVNLIDATTAKQVRQIQCSTYGVGIVRYTHHDYSILCSSKNKEQKHDIRYLSLYDNKYLRFFNGHTKRVVSMSMSPCDDSFISTSEDSTLRLWDLRQQRCQAMLQLEGSPCCSYDNQGLVFAVSDSRQYGPVTQHFVKLYDAREYEHGPFQSFKVSCHGAPSAISFSPDGSMLLLAANSSGGVPGYAVCLDAFEGNALVRMTAPASAFPPRNAKAEGGDGADGAARAGGSSPQASLAAESFCFTPDSKYVLAGSSDGNVCVWDASSGELSCQWSGHAGPVGMVRFNPRYEMAMSACSYTAMWVPDLEGGARSFKPSGAP